MAASGYVLDNTLLIVSGTLVGAAGTLLTRLMAEAMGRSIFTILLGYAREVLILPGYAAATPGKRLPPRAPSPGRAAANTVT